MLISKRLPSEHYTRLCDITLWVTKQYGPAKRPTVPKILSRGSLLSRWKEDNPTTVLDWASDNFARLLDDMDLCDLPLQLVANGEKADTYPSKSFDSLRSRCWTSGQYPGYFVDEYGRPILYYDPRKCDQTGYFLGQILPKLIMIKLFVNARPKAFDNYTNSEITDAMICHFGHGFNMLHNIEATSSQSITTRLLRQNQHHRRLLHFAYGSVISLSAHRYSPEQIISTYGPILSKTTRQLVWPIYKTIEKDAEFIKLLRLMTDNRRQSLPVTENNYLKHSVLPEHSRQRQAR